MAPTSWSRRPAVTSDIYDFQVRDGSGSLVNISSDDSLVEQVHADPDYAQDTVWTARPAI